MEEILVILAVDVSATMKGAWGFRHEDLTTTKFSSIAEMLQGVAIDACNLANKNLEFSSQHVKLIVYGFGFGNILSFLQRKKVEQVQELLMLPDKVSPITLHKLQQDWDLYAKNIESLMPLMGGGTPLAAALEIIERRVSTEKQQQKYKEVALFIISDGKPTDSQPNAIATSTRLKTQGVDIFTCYLTSLRGAVLRMLYPPPGPSGNEASYFMYQLASPASASPRVASYVRDAGWMVPEGAQLFFEVNDFTVLEDFMQVFFRSMSGTVPQTALPRQIHNSDQYDLQLEYNAMVYAKISDFLYLDFVANGCNGAVFKVKCKIPPLDKSDKVYVLKYLMNYTTDKEQARIARAEFEREVIILRNFLHPNIIRQYAAFEAKLPDSYLPAIKAAMPDVHEFLSNPSMCIIYPFLPRSFKQYMQQVGTLTLPLMVRFLFDMLHGLHHLQIHRCVHKDLKPDNILVDTTGRFVICDVGLAYQFNDDSMTIVHTENLHPWGNQDAKPPELDNITLGTLLSYKKADIYSLGCIACKEMDPTFNPKISTKPVLPKPFAALTPFIHALLSPAQARPSPSDAIKMLTDVMSFK